MTLIHPKRKSLFLSLFLFLSPTSVTPDLRFLTRLTDNEVRGIYNSETCELRLADLGICSGHWNGNAYLYLDPSSYSELNGVRILIYV